VPTLGGSRILQIPPGTAHGTEITIRGEGIRNFRSGAKGNEVVKINVVIPKNLSAEERDLIEKFRDLNEKRGEGKRHFGIF